MPKISKNLLALFIWSQLLLLAFPCILFANTILVTNNNGNNDPGTLGAALQMAGDGDIIDCSPISGQTIFITNFRLPAIGYNFSSTTSSLTILGAGVTLDGGNMYPALSLAQGSAIISDFTVQNTSSQGGSGGAGLTGGGGGSGGGGALYLHSSTTMTISAVTLNDNQAIGGSGGAGNTTGGSGAGGGGYGGGGGGIAINTGVHAGSAGGGGGNNGGSHGARDGGVGSPNSFTNFAGAGGGGEIPGVSSARAGGSNASIPARSGGSGGTGSIANGAGAGGGGGSGGSGFAGANAIDAPSPGTGVGGAGGHGFGIGNSYGAGGGGGGGNGGGAGLGASGGGGGVTGPGGRGGIFGGGGGAASSNAGVTHIGGDGGFGAGGGAGNTGGIDIYGLGGNGGSATGLPAGGGGGSGLGGAILIQEGALLIIQDGTHFSGNSTTAGMGGMAASGGTNGGNGSSLGEDIFIQAGGGLSFQIDGTLTLLNPIEGAGSASGPGVIKSGSGIVNLNGVNTYLGNTFIQSGTLNLNGSVTGDTTIESGGTLSGSATVADNIYNNGTLSPGNNSIGTMNSTNLFQSATSVYIVDLDATGDSDEIITSGSVQIGGSLIVIPENFNYTSSPTYTIISSGTGITGTFSSVTNAMPGFTTNWFIENNQLLLNLIYTGSNITANANRSDTIGVATALSQMTFNTLSGDLLEIFNAINQLSNNPTAMNNALAATAPIVDHSVLAVWNEQQFINHILLSQSRLAENATMNTRTQGYSAGDRGDDPSHLWANVWSNHFNQQMRQQIPGYTGNAGGILVGGDIAVEWGNVGWAADISRLHFNGHVSPSTTRVDHYALDLYGRYAFADHFFIDSIIAGGYNRYKSSSNVVYGNVNISPQSAYYGWQLDILARGGMNYEVFHVEATPYILAEFDYLNLSSYKQMNAGTANQMVLSQDFDQFLLGVGIELTQVFKCERVIIQPDVYGNYLYAIKNATMQTTSQFAAGPAFVTMGATPPRSKYQFGAEIKFISYDDWDATFSYDVQIEDDFIAQGGYVRWRYRW